MLILKIYLEDWYSKFSPLKKSPLSFSQRRSKGDFFVLLFPPSADPDNFADEWDIGGRIPCPNLPRINLYSN